LAQPYTLYGDHDIVHTYYPPKDSIGAAAGLISTLLDLAKYDAAIDRHVFLKSETQQKAVIFCLSLVLMTDVKEFVYFQF
jgi:hypothetical protein